MQHTQKFMGASVMMLVVTLLLVLSASATSESVADTLREGETGTYTLNGLDYEVTLVFVTDPVSNAAEAKFSINGELTTALSAGETNTIACGSITTYSVLATAREGVASFTLQNTGAEPGCSPTPVPPTPSDPTMITDTLREGETRTYTLNGLDYEIALVLVTDPNQVPATAKFSVNGELTAAMQVGETAALACADFRVRDILVNAREGVATFKLSNPHACNYNEQKPEPLRGPVTIVVGRTAPTSDVLHAIDLAKAIQSGDVTYGTNERYEDDVVQPLAVGLAMLDTDAYAAAKYYNDDLEDNLVIVIADKKALIIKGQRLTTEQNTMYTRAKRHFSDEGFTQLERAASVDVHKYLLRERMLKLFEPTATEPTQQDPDPDDDEVCVQVATPALNPSTQQCIVFSTPCDVPTSWLKVSSCGASVTPPSTEKSCTSGCLIEDLCAPIGTRLANGNANYCGLDGLHAQKADSSTCQNNYECKSNQCYNAVCVSLEKDVQETKGLMQSIANWFARVFG